MKKSLIPIAIFIIIQFFQPKQNHAINGQAHYDDLASILSIPDDVKPLLISACFDCHSNETRYPWYGKITPVNYLLAHGVNEGKEHFNFSTISDLPLDKQAMQWDEYNEMIENKEMPEGPYKLMHKDARLTDEQRTTLINFGKEKIRQAEEQIINIEIEKRQDQGDDSTSESESNSEDSEE